MTSRNRVLRLFHGFLALLYLMSSTASAATLNFIVKVSKPVTVTGTPRIAVQVGDDTRYATYSGGSTTDTLTFGYTVQQRDFDANGITLVSPLDLNGGSIKDAAGNSATNLSFTLPNTSGINIQTYTVAFSPTFTSSPINSANASAVSFTINKAPAGGRYDYRITSDGGAGSIEDFGYITSNSQTVSNVNVSSLPVGTLTLSVTISTTNGGTGAARTATATLDNQPPAGYSITGLPAYVNLANSASTSLQISGGEIGASYSVTVSSSSGTPVVKTGTITADPQAVTGFDLSGLADGTLTVTLVLTDTNGNAGSAVTASVVKDVVAPTIALVTPPANGTYDDQ